MVKAVGGLGRGVVHKFLLELVDQLADALGMRNKTKTKLPVLAGGLNVNGAVAERCRQNAVNFNRNVFDFFKTETGDVAREKTDLFYVHQSFIGDNPNVKIVEGPD